MKDVAILRSVCQGRSPDRMLAYHHFEGGGALCWLFLHCPDEVHIALSNFFFPPCRYDDNLGSMPKQAVEELFGEEYVSTDLD